jgi:hypothetical protein
VHSLLVETPGGAQRSFRFGTATPDVPAKAGDRVTLVCAPQRPQFSRGLLNASPPGVEPGEALSLSNHASREVTSLLRPPPPGAGALPRWALPALLVLGASDASTALVDPSLPYAVAGVLVAAAAAGVAGTSVLLPRLKQLPPDSLEIQATRQRLLGQHAALEGRVAALVGECEEGVRSLARLWQLQSKMGAVAAGGAYDARLERVAAACGAVEEGLVKRVEMVDAYARVISMIEIEVEMETEVPAAEVQGEDGVHGCVGAASQQPGVFIPLRCPQTWSSVLGAGIEAQIARLGEIEELQAEWRVQAEAQDEVERLLRASP